MKLFLLDPCNTKDYLQDRFFAGPFGVLQRLLRERGVELHTYDLGDITKADKILFYNYNEQLLRRCQAAGVPQERLVLFIVEPRVVAPEQYEARVHDCFGQIFAVPDELLDNKKFFKVRFIQGQRFLPQLPAFEERKFLTLINANKYSYIDGELYSYRRRAIRYFDLSGRFDLFGFGWNNKSILKSRGYLLAAVKQGKLFKYANDFFQSLRDYQSYRGSIGDKYEILKNYKFCLTFENEIDTRGYLTEKIFDCFFCGTVPIYLGAADIAQQVPADSFIDMRRFKNFRKLADYLQRITVQEFAALQASGQQFIRSEAFKIWRPEGTFQDVIEHLLI